MRTIKFICAAIVALLVAIVCFANGTEVPLRVWPDLTGYGVPASPSWSLPLFFVLLVAGFIGFLLGAAREWVREGRIRTTARQAKREASNLRSKVDELTAEGPDDIPALPRR